MRVDRISRRVLLVATVAGLLMFAASSQRSRLLLFNRTPSLPTGFYVYCGSQVHRGDVVAFALPQPAWHYAHLRGESIDVLLLKHVLAVGGDFVSTYDGQLRVNSELVGPVASVDSAARPLPHWSAARVLAGDELIVGSTHDRSFDSRYFGPIHTDQVLGVYRRLTFHSLFVGPTDSESQSDPLSVDPALPSARNASGG